MKRLPGKSDRKVLLAVTGSVLVLLVVMGVLAPASGDNDPRPSTLNSGSDGAKAAYLLLEAMGRAPKRWEKPLDELEDVDAKNATLVLAEPQYAPDSVKVLAAQVKRFLERGGRVLATGPQGGALLPDSDLKPPSTLMEGLCYTTPEGPGELARAGEVELEEQARWVAEGPRFRTEQRCGGDAVVVRYAVEGGAKGEVIWWTSAMPLTNAGLRKDANLKLLLASLGDGREVIFDEAMQVPGESVWEVLKGLPLLWVSLQAVLVALLLVFSFSRRRGPVRAPVSLPRSSPVEFAESMGDLYEKAGATHAATEAARRRLLRVLTREAGLSQATVLEGPEAIAKTLQQRLGGDWSRLAKHLEDAAASAGEEISAGSALALVRAMSEDAEEIRLKISPPVARAVEPELVA